MPTNVVCKLHYLSAALPTLHEPISYQLSAISYQLSVIGYWP
ncbi:MULTISPECIES: hypothetical protein [unclassified Moorena]|nr:MULTISPECIES: hypothetical protein [unclassified Moorena]